MNLIYLFNSFFFQSFVEFCSSILNETCSFVFEPVDTASYKLNLNTQWSIQFLKDENKFFILKVMLN